jgi:hypothetical protein
MGLLKSKSSRVLKAFDFKGNPMVRAYGIVTVRVMEGKEVPTKTNGNISLPIGEKSRWSFRSGGNAVIKSINQGRPPLLDFGQK